MIVHILIALAAGCASALMFASIVSGAMISLLLFYLAPLPLMLAAIGWGSITALVGGAAALAGVGAASGFSYMMAFAVTVVVPACWLGHLALLGRPVTPPQLSEAAHPTAAPVVEWYPVGRILLWIAGFATLTTMAALLTLGTDSTSITAALRHGLTRILSATSTGDGESTELVDALVSVAAPAAAIVAMVTLTLNLWLAATIAAQSGRLRRPWPDLRSAALPHTAFWVLVIALGVGFAGGIIAMVSQVIGAALTIAYALTGLAVLHTITLAMKNRALWLSSIYAVIMVFGWPVLAMVGLGLADAVFGIRRRYHLRHTPPPPAAV